MYFRGVYFLTQKLFHPLLDTARPIRYSAIRIHEGRREVSVRLSPPKSREENRLLDSTQSAYERLRPGQTPIIFSNGSPVIVLPMSTVASTWRSVRCEMYSFRGF